jgi:NTE family protein
MKRLALSMALSMALAALAGALQAQTPPTAGAQPPAGRPTVGAESPAGRPTVGLVLGGGGARGAAHIGVLEVLERERIRVDCVAGTSMGALVAGAWAAGLSPAQMKAALAKADWADMFLDNPGFDDLNFRNKRLSQRFLPGTETGLTDRGAISPPGVVGGQKIKLFLNQLVHADAGERTIEALPLALSIIATDIGNGQRMVLRQGSLTQAMRASMAVPGLLAPLTVDGRRMVDGGLTDNVPIREVRERCGAEVVIAVNVGSPLLPPEQVSGIFSVAAQMVALLTEQNVSASLATLKSGDIYIQPDLDTITAGEFERHAEAAERGRAAAEQAVEKLRALSVDGAAWAAWRARMTPRSDGVPRVDAIEIAAAEGSRVNPAVLQRYLDQRVGQPLDTVQLNRDLLRAYGDGYYEQVDYSLVRRNGRNVLRVMPVEKPWGPDYLRLGLRLDSTLAQGSTYQLRAGYQRTWLNRLGGEWLVVAELGSATGVSTELYQPLDAAQRWFTSTRLGYRRERVDFFVGDERFAEYRSARSTADIALGLNFSLVGQLRAGWRAVRQRNELETGFDVFSALPNPSTAGWQVALDLDQNDGLYFPRRGWQIQAAYFDAPKRDYAKLTLDANGALPVGAWVLGARASLVDSPRGTLPLGDMARLGGFLNLSGYATGQWLGDDVSYAHLRAERIIGRLPLGLRGDMRIGLAMEAGRVRQQIGQRDSGWLDSVTVYLGGETPLGPAFVGLGRARDGSVNAYLVVGTP